MPSSRTADSLLAHHGLTSLEGVAFFAAAECKLPDGRRLAFEAGAQAGVEEGGRKFFLLQRAGEQRVAAEAATAGGGSVQGGGGMHVAGRQAALFRGSQLRGPEMERGAGHTSTIPPSL